MSLSDRIARLALQTKPKNVHRTSRVALLTLTLLFCSATLTYAARRSGFTSFDFPGAFETHGQGITAAGEVVGVYAPMANSFVHGFVLHNGNFTPFDVPGADFTDAGWINSRGQIVGTYGFLLRKGNFESIDIPGALFTEANGINPEGDIVGRYASSDGKVHGYLHSRVK
jgi:hypothetical protein